MAKAPDRNSCLDIKNNGVKDTVYYKDDEWWSGNCKVKLSAGPVSGSTPSMTGAYLKRAIQDILDVCDSGFKYYNGVRIEVNLCTLGRGGSVTECASPLQKVSGFPSKKRDTFPKRRHLTDVSSTQSGNPAHVLARSSEPYPGIICGGGPGSARIDDCMAALDDLKKAKRVDLPYKKMAAASFMSTPPRAIRNG